MTEFQSHEPEFDYLKSQEINEKIGQIAWCPRVSQSHLLLTANEKTIKLWRVKEKQVHAVLENNTSMAKKLAQTDVRLPLMLPKLGLREPSVTSSLRRTFGNVHAYHLNSISPCADGELFLSADDLRINMWNYGRADEAFSMVDIKPDRIEHLLEVITTAAFHPTIPHCFAYATSKGAIWMSDLRTSAQCDRDARLFDSKAACSSDPASKLQLFGEIMSSVSDISFNPNNSRLFASRDFLTVKVWDMANDRRPLAILPVHDYLRPRLNEIYESDAIFDKFEVAWTASNKVMTGTYHNYVKQLDFSTAGEKIPSQTIHSDKVIFRTLRKQANQSRSSASLSSKTDYNSGVCEVTESDTRLPFGMLNNSDIDIDKRVLQLTTHSKEQVVAVAACTNLFIFSGTSSGSAYSDCSGPRIPDEEDQAMQM